MKNTTFGCAATEVLNAMMWKCINLHLFKSCAFQARFTAFAENYEYIQRENAKGYSYKLGLNEFSDMSMDEFKMSKLGMMPKSMWGNVPSGGVHKVSNASLPKSVDWRDKGSDTSEEPTAMRILFHVWSRLKQKICENVRIQQCF